MNEQLALLLQEVRKSRESLKEIADSTARYAGIVLTATADGPLGAPPLTNNALRVYVTNINELTAGGNRGLGSIIEGFLGGIGRFAGGALGSFVAGVTQSLDLKQIAHIADTVAKLTPDVRAIVDAVQVIQKASGPTVVTGPPTESLNVLGMAAEALQAGAAGPPAPSGAAERWLALLREVTHVVKGLMILVPLLVGAFSAFLVRLHDVQAAIVGLLSFAIENALVLRGVVLVTVYDTIAAAAQLAGQVLGIIAEGMQGAIASIFDAISGGLTGALDVIQILATGLKATIDPLLAWLRNGLGSFLVFLGDTRAFRLVIHLANQLPSVLPAILLLLDKKPDEQTKEMLRGAQQITMPGTVGPTGNAKPQKPAEFPDVTLGLPALRDAVKQVTAEAKPAMVAGIGGALGSVVKTMDRISQAGQGALARNPEFDRALNADLEQAKVKANLLTRAVKPAEDALAAARPGEAVQAMADAYQGWITGSGFKNLVETITEYFGRSAEGPLPERSIPGRIYDGVNAQPPAATVDIAEVIVEIGAAPAPPVTATSASTAPGPMSRLELVARGGDPDDHEIWSTVA